MLRVWNLEHLALIVTADVPLIEWESRLDGDGRGVHIAWSIAELEVNEQCDVRVVLDSVSGHAKNDKTGFIRRSLVLDGRSGNWLRLGGPSPRYVEFSLSLALLTR